MSHLRKILTLMLLSISVAIIFFELFHKPRTCSVGLPPEDTTNSSKTPHRTDPETPRIRIITVKEKQEDELYNLSSHRTLYHQQGLELYIQSVFLDDRFSESVIRIFGMQKKDNITQDFSCKWEHAESGTTVKSEVKARRVIIDSSWPHWSPYFAVTFDCHFPKQVKPNAIQLISRDGRHEYFLPVEQILKTEPRKPLAVCVKPMTGSFSVSRLVEWFEIQRMAGYTDIIMYDTEVQYGSGFVLKYYESLGLLKVIPFPYLMSLLQHVDDPPMKGEDRYAVYQQTYIVAMHDCLYRFRGLYDNILFIDVDEVLLPTNNTSIIDVVTNIRKTYIHGAGFLFNTAWHFEENQNQSDPSIPEYMYMYKNRKATIPVDNQPKSMIATDRAISMNFHQLLDVPEKKYSNEYLPWDKLAYLHHFRGRCDQKFEKERCANLFSKVREDPVIPRYMSGLRPRVDKIIHQLVLKF